MTADRWFGLGFIALAIGMTMGVAQIKAPFGRMGDPGPSLLPLLLAAGIGILGVLLAFRRRSGAPAEEASSDGTAANASVEHVSPPSVAVRVMLAVALIAYVALFERIGFTFATLLFLAATMILLGDRGPRSLAVSLGLAAAVALSIGGFLAGVIGVPLPGVWMP